MNGFHINTYRYASFFKELHNIPLHGIILTCLAFPLSIYIFAITDSNGKTSLGIYISELEQEL